jgi:hypothetical protein
VRHIVIQRDVHFFAEPTEALAWISVDYDSHIALYFLFDNSLFTFFCNAPNLLHML